MTLHQSPSSAHLLYSSTNPEPLFLKKKKSYRIQFSARITKWFNSFKYRVLVLFILIYNILQIPKTMIWGSIFFFYSNFFSLFWFPNCLTSCRARKAASCFLIPVCINIIYYLFSDRITIIFDVSAGLVTSGQGQNKPIKRISAF